MEYSEKKITEISGTLIGKEYPCYIIGEIGINHNGEIDIAKKLIDEAVAAGANAVKFQKRSLNDLYRMEVLENPNIESQGLEILLDVLKNLFFHVLEIDLKVVGFLSDVSLCFFVLWGRPRGHFFAHPDFKKSLFPVSISWRFF